MTTAQDGGRLSALHTGRLVEWDVKMSRKAITQKFGKCVVIYEHCNDVNRGNCQGNVFVCECDAETSEEV